MNITQFYKEFVMSMLSLSINNIYNEIPDEIIEEAFVIPFRKNRFAPVSADAMIIQEVINKRVMPDLNIEYATKLNVPMRDCKVEMVTPTDWIVTVPDEVTNNRKIITVLGVNLLDLYAETGGIGTGGLSMPTSSGGAILTGAQKMANATSGLPLNYEVKVDMISGNSFRIRRTSYITTNCYIELIIENDPQLNNIPITAADYIKKLVLLATKAYIYRKLKIRIGQAKLDGGAELGEFMQFIDSYADANELYLEELKYASRIQWLGNEEMKYDFMQMLVPNNI